MQISEDLFCLVICPYMPWTELSTSGLDVQHLSREIRLFARSVKATLQSSLFTNSCFEHAKAPSL